MVTKISICIPRLDRFSSRKTIHNVLEKYKLGSINRIDIVGWGEVRRAFIHFESWNETHPPAKNILDRMALYIKRGNDCLQIMHNINATAIPRSMGKFSHIIFNHPHLGIENLKTHQMLLSHFFHSCKRHVETGAFYGKVYVSLLDGQGERWQIIDRARRRGFKCKYVLPFSTSSYDVKRTRNGKSFKSTITKKNNNSTLKSFMYCFSIL